MGPYRFHFGQALHRFEPLNELVVEFGATFLHRVVSGLLLPSP